MGATIATMVLNTADLCEQCKIQRDENGTKDRLWLLISDSVFKGSARQRHRKATSELKPHSALGIKGELKKKLSSKTDKGLILFIFPFPWVARTWSSTNDREGFNVMAPVLCKWADLYTGREYLTR